jgi:hypothetical protein
MPVKTVNLAEAMDYSAIAVMVVRVRQIPEPWINRPH